MSTPPVIQQGRRPSDEDKFYLEWGRETLKNNVSLVNEVLKQLITVNAGLLGGSVAFLDAQLMAPAFKNWVVFVFFAALILSFLSLLPYEGRALLQSPEDIRRHKKRALTYKMRFLYAVAIVMAVGFAIAIAGVILRYPIPG